jgi:hypothetical protein
LNDHDVEYLLIGGYAVGYYGYPRTTADMDIWVAMRSDNAQKLVHVFQQFGMLSDEITEELFLQSGDIVRMGLPPMRIEILNDIDGVEFGACYKRRSKVVIDKVSVNVVSLQDLRCNKLASGRHKDLDDIEHLPEE